MSLYRVYKKPAAIVDIDKIAKFCLHLFSICNLIANIPHVFFLERLNPPPPKPEKIRSTARDSPSRLQVEGARGKRASLAPRPKQNQLAPPVSSSRALSPGRRGSRMRSQSVQLAQAPLSSSLNSARRAR